MLAAVLGWPIQHSRSPKLHGHWLKRYAIPGSYVALPVRPEDLAFCLPALPKMGFRGCNLTLPHKEIVLPLLDEIEDAARAVGAVNTVCFEDDRFFGVNTDIYGFSEYLRVMAPEFHGDAGPVVILGAGGVARAALYALIARGVREIRILNRSRGRADALVQAFARPGVRLYTVDLKEAEAALQTAVLLVNASSLGMVGQADFTLPLEGLAREAIVYDLVYNPLETGLLRAAKARGLRTVDGLGMLLYQAKPAFHRFFGVDPTVDEALRAATLL